ncbi:MAG: Ig-like domain-containing protein, partial [Limisphaerales bacterium]
MESTEQVSIGVVVEGGISSKNPPQARKTAIAFRLALVLLPLLTMAGVAQSWDGTVLNAVPRPRLSITPQELVNVKTAIAQQTWATRSYNSLLKDAQSAAATGYGTLPAVGSSAHKTKAAAILKTAMAGRLGDRRELLDSAADGLVAYAKLYPTVSWSGKLGRLLPSSALDEALWFIPLVEAYDLLADTGVLTSAERTLIEKSLIRAAIPVFKIDDYSTDVRNYQLYKCSNHHAYHFTAVGLAGLALGDATLVDWAINHPYGFRHFVGHVLRDDGVHWERSMPYHRYTLNGLLRLTEAAYRCGLDLYGMRTEGMADLVVENHYSTDVTRLPKGLKMAFEVFPQLRFPDGSYPQYGDGDTFWNGAAEQDLVGLRRYRTPAMAWHAERSGLLQPTSTPDWRTMVTLASMGDMSQYQTLARQWNWADGTFANSGQVRNGSSLFPSSGITVLRETTGADDRLGTASAVMYGPFGGGHGHAAQLGMVMYSGGKQWVRQFGPVPYGTPEKGGWTTQTISHNTVVVGKVSQNPVGTSTVEWPSDSSSSRVQGRLVQFDGPGKRVVVESEKAYPGLKLRRTQQLSGHNLVDDFTVEPVSTTTTTRSFDYVLHIEGQYESSSFGLTATSGALGVNSGYKYVQKRMTATVSAPGWVKYQSAGEQLKVWVVPTPGQSCQLILADGPSESTSRRVPMLILSSSGTSAAFTTVLEESGGAKETLVAASTKNNLLTLNYGTRSETVTLGTRWGIVTPDKPANSVPVAVADAATTKMNTAVSGNLAANDTASTDGGNVWSRATTPANGTATVNSNGSYTYTPATSFTGTDSFTYALRDANGDTVTATVTVTVNNGVPVAVADEFTVPPNKAFIGNLGANDQLSSDGAHLWWLWSTPANGSLTVN